MTLYDVMLFLHFIGLALGVGTSFAMLTLGLATRDLSGEERGKFMLRAIALGKNGSVGLSMLLVSGIGIMLHRGVAATFTWGGPAFHAKLTLVVLLLGCLGYSQVLIRRVKRAGGGPALATLPKVGRVMLLLGVGTVACAVLAFH